MKNCIGNRDKRIHRGLIKDRNRIFRKKGDLCYEFCYISTFNLRDPLSKEFDKTILIEVILVPRPTNPSLAKALAFSVTHPNLHTYIDTFFHKHSKLHEY